MAEGEIKVARKSTAKRPAVKRAHAVGRPRIKDNPRAASPRDAILKVASELFAQKGFAGTTMAEIADVVGIRGPSLYYHFKDKSDVLRALAEVGLGGALRDSAMLRKDGAHSVPARLYYMIHELVVRLRSAPYEMSVVFDQAFRSKEFSDVNKRIALWLTDVEAIVNDGVLSREFVTDNAKATAYMIRCIVETAIPHFGAYAQFEPNALADHVANFALRGLLRETRKLTSVQREFQEFSLTMHGAAGAIDADGGTVR